MTPRQVTSEERRQLIIRAATQLIAEKGLRNATNKEIAQTAGVTAAALYWYFPTKDDLFWAVVQQNEAPITTLRGLLESMFDMPPHVVFTQVATYFINVFRTQDKQEFMKVMISEGLRQPEVAAYFNDKVVGGILAFLEHYLEHQVELGRLRPHRSDVAVQMFIGSLIAMIIRNFLSPGWMAQFTENDMVQQMVEILLRGLANGSATTVV